MLDKMIPRLCYKPGSQYKIAVNAIGFGIRNIKSVFES